MHSGKTMLASRAFPCSRVGAPQTLATALLVHAISIITMAKPSPTVHGFPLQRSARGKAKQRWQVTQNPSVRDFAGALSGEHKNRAHKTFQLK